MHIIIISKINIMQSFKGQMKVICNRSVVCQMEKYPRATTTEDMVNSLHLASIRRATMNAQV